MRRNIDMSCTTIRRSGRLAVGVLCGLMVLASLAPDLWAARRPVKGREGGDNAKVDPKEAEAAALDYKAYDMLKRAEDLIREGQEERGIKMLTSIPRMFPESKVRYEAYLAVGKYYIEKRQFDLALKQFQILSESGEEEQRAEALYQVGICHYSMNDYDKAFGALRQVTNEYPGSVFANEAYYYMGQCHFKLGRWAKAVEALKMVGTSVSSEVTGQREAEAGQRLFVKVNDKDLVVLQTSKVGLKVEFTSEAGDKETVPMEPLGKTGDYFIGSVQTVPGEPVPGDKLLQISGLAKVAVRYLDENTEGGKREVPVVQQVTMVSTAAAGFTDGAYREYVQGVFGDGECFMRVKDLDRDTTIQKDQVQVKVWSQYKVQKDQVAEDAPSGAGVDLSEDGSEKERLEKRDGVTVTLTETEPHSGLFVGTIVPKVGSEQEIVDQADATLSAAKGDDVILEYWDEKHMLGEEGRIVAAKAKVLIGEIQDVKIVTRHVDSVDLKARKNLIEAKIYLRLGQIFKDVGLLEKANEKAEQGLERTEDVISTSLKASLERSLVEEAFSVKWELLLVQDKLNEAIQVCRALTQLFPDSALVDRALLKIGLAKMEAKDPQEAIPILNGILALPKSDLKAEAQYNIARVYEMYARQHAGEKEPDLSRALLAYNKCAETYPQSPFAGESLDKIANFYIASGDFPRAVELMERVFQDYPDASFLDSMLLKWVIASYRMGNYQIAQEKANQLLAEYPSSQYAEKAKKFLEVIEKKL